MYQLYVLSIPGNSLRRLKLRWCHDHLNNQLTLILYVESTKTSKYVSFTSISP